MQIPNGEAEIAAWRVDTPAGFGLHDAVMKTPFSMTSFLCSRVATFHELE